MLKVISYNIHKGFGFRNRRFVLREMRAALHKLDPDLLFLQEVVGQNTKLQQRTSDWPLESQADFVANGRWPALVYGANARYTAGHHGNCILSKYPITYSKNTDISVSKLERRGLLHATIEHPAFPAALDLFCVHLDFRERGRHAQLSVVEQELLSVVTSEKPFILAGDFNDWKHRASMAIFSLGSSEAVHQLTGRYAKTFPGPFPVLALDRIYYRGFEVLEAGAHTERPWPALSDHLPVHATLLPIDTE